MNIDIWNIEYKKVRDLLPNERNPRTITEEKFNSLKKKIEEVGFHNPPKLDNKGIILGGNQRVKALLDLGAGDLKIPVMVPTRNLTEDERKEIIVTDNVSDGTWNYDILSEEYDQKKLEEWGIKTLQYEDWSSNIEDMNKIKEDDSSAPGKISISCFDGDVDDIKELIKVTLEEHGFTGCTIS